MQTQKEDNLNAPATMAPAAMAPADFGPDNNAPATISSQSGLPEHIDPLGMAEDTILIFEALEQIEFRKKSGCGMAALRFHSASMAYVLHTLVSNDSSDWLDFEYAVCQKFGCCDLWDFGVIPALVDAAFEKWANCDTEIASCFADIVRERVEEASSS